MNPDQQSREEFADLYIAFVRALVHKQGKNYPELSEALMSARRLYGESLTSVIVQWAEETASIRTQICDGETSFLTNPPPCMQRLCLDRIWADSDFGKKSRENLLKYVQELTMQSHMYTNPPNVEQEDKQEDLPPVENTFCFNSDTGRLRAAQKLANTLPESFMKKIGETLDEQSAEGEEGDFKMDNLDISKVMRDMMSKLDAQDMMQIMGNASSMFESLNDPEIKAMMQGVVEGVGKQ